MFSIVLPIKEYKVKCIHDNGRRNGVPSPSHGIKPPARGWGFMLLAVLDNPKTSQLSEVLGQERLEDFTPYSTVTYSAPLAPIQMMMGFQMPWKYAAQI